MSDSTKALIAFVFAVVGFIAMVIGLVDMDHRQVREMAEQGYVWVPTTQGHYEKAK